MDAPAHRPRRHAARNARIAIGVLGLAVVAWFAATKLDWAEIGAAMRGAEPGWLAAAFLLNIVSLLVRGAGWTVAARVAVERPLGIMPAERAFLVGQAVNTGVPGRVGELAKVVVAQIMADGGAVLRALMPATPALFP